jgi:hypothetical protein
MDPTARQGARTPRSRLQSALLGGLCAVVASCSHGGAPPAPADAAVPTDATMPTDAARGAPDAGLRDGASPDLTSAPPDLAMPLADLAMPPPDLAMPPPDLSKGPDLVTPPPDLAIVPDLAWSSAQDVDIYVDNTCKMDVVPKVFNVPRGTVLRITNHNRSHDYPVTVWMSYGGGYTDLMTGGTWADPIDHCRLPRPYDEYADISTACSSYRLMIHCL